MMGGEEECFEKARVDVGGGGIGFVGVARIDDFGDLAILV